MFTSLHTRELTRHTLITLLTHTHTRTHTHTHTQFTHTQFTHTHAHTIHTLILHTHTLTHSHTHSHTHTQFTHSHSHYTHSHTHSQEPEKPPEEVLNVDDQGSKLSPWQQEMKARKVSYLIFLIPHFLTFAVTSTNE